MGFKDALFGLFGKKTSQPSNQVTDQDRLNILRSGLIQQLPLTPQAAQNLRQMPLTLYGSDDPNDKENLSAGYFNPTKSGLFINKNTLKNRGGTQGPAETMLHEFTHSQDSNITGNTGNLINSSGFADLLRKYYPANYTRTMDTLISNPELYDPTSKVKDVEGLAYPTGSAWQMVTRNPKLAPVYSRMFTPMTKVINFSPYYPTGEYFNQVGPINSGR